MMNSKTSFTSGLIFFLLFILGLAMSSSDSDESERGGSSSDEELLCCYTQYMHNMLNLLITIILEVDLYSFKWDPFTLATILLRFDIS